jgi:hypothetical protein
VTPSQQNIFECLALITTLAVPVFVLGRMTEVDDLLRALNRGGAATVCGGLLLLLAGLLYLLITHSR